MGESRKRKISRGLALLIAGMLAGTVMLSPVGAHISNFNHLKTKHFYTKKAADQRFINVGEEASSAATAKSADTAKTADTAGRATNFYAANVDGSGAMLRSVPAGATSRRAGVGDYVVSFQRGFAGCVVSSSLATNEIGEINVAYSPANPNELLVRTANSAGGLADRGFAVLMICP